MDLAVNNLQRLMCHKTQPTYQPMKSVSQVQNLDKAVCASLCTNAREKSANPFILLDMGK